MYVHIHHSHPYNLSTLSCYSSKAAFNDCYCELIPYTALDNSYGVSACDASGADPRESLGSGDPLQSVSYSKVSTLIDYFTGAV